MNVESYVVDFHADRLQGLTPDEIPPGWDLITLVGGPYDGLPFIRPDDQPDLEVVLPVSAADETGMGNYARYVRADAADRVQFVEFIRQRGPDSLCECDD